MPELKKIFLIKKEEFLESSDYTQYPKTILFDLESDNNKKILTIFKDGNELKLNDLSKTLSNDLNSLLESYPKETIFSEKDSSSNSRRVNNVSAFLCKSIFEPYSEQNKKIFHKSVHNGYKLFSTVLEKIYDIYFGSFKNCKTDSEIKNLKEKYEISGLYYKFGLNLEPSLQSFDYNISRFMIYFSKINGLRLISVGFNYVYNSSIIDLAYSDTDKIFNSPFVISDLETVNYNRFLFHIKCSLSTDNKSLKRYKNSLVLMRMSRAIQIICVRNLLLINMIKNNKAVFPEKASIYFAPIELHILEQLSELSNKSDNINSQLFEEYLKSNESSKNKLIKLINNYFCILEYKEVLEIYQKLIKDKEQLYLSKDEFKTILDNNLKQKLFITEKINNSSKEDEDKNRENLSKFIY